MKEKMLEERSSTLLPRIDGTRSVFSRNFDVDPGSGT